MHWNLTPGVEPTHLQARSASCERVNPIFQLAIPEDYPGFHAIDHLRIEKENDEQEVCLFDICTRKVRHNLAAIDAARMKESRLWTAAIGHLSLGDNTWAHLSLDV